MTVCFINCYDSGFTDIINNVPQRSVRAPFFKWTYPTTSVKYLGVKIDENLTWQHHFLITSQLNQIGQILYYSNSASF